MGFFDFLFSGGEDSQLKKHIKRLTNLNAPQEERLLSAQWLADKGSPEALAGLLKRFSLVYEKQMKDIEEKEYLYKLLRSQGEAAVEPTKTWIRENTAFAIPLRIVEEFEGPEKTVSFLLELLGLEMDPFKTEKKRQIIIKLGDFTDERIISPVSACLFDYDEEVRLASIETLHKQNSDECHEPFVEALTDPEEESNRLKIRIAEILEQRGWDLLDKGDRLQHNPPVGWRFSAENNRLVKV